MCPRPYPHKMTLGRKILFLARDLIFPGLDLHTRNRAALCCFWRTGKRDVLDAGSGNGYFSWLAYKSGANVLALNFETRQVKRARSYFLDHHKADPSRLSFEQRNLYELDSEQRTFDEIICYETLEHIRNDEAVLRSFYRILRPGGVLHLCCPNSDHPRHRREVLDLSERGGHVRPGYTAGEYDHLLTNVGFHPEKVVGLGSKSLYRLDQLLRTIRNKFGDVAALPVLPIGLLFLRLERLDPPLPFSLYVRAIKPGGSGPNARP